MDIEERFTEMSNGLLRPTPALPVTELYGGTVRQKASKCDCQINGQRNEEFQSNQEPKKFSGRFTLRLLGFGGQPRKFGIRVWPPQNEITFSICI